LKELFDGFPSFSTEFGLILKRLRMEVQNRISGTLDKIVQ